MGACEFSTTAKGKTAKEAFRNAVEDARHEHGHGGYSGTIAEKHDFTMIAPPVTRAECVSDMDFENKAQEFADSLLSNDDHRVADKWGPAGCIQIRSDTFLFFGVASS